ncbi:Ubiquitin carboxyl-terminal hydrolase 7 [Candida tropicalis]
MSESLDSTLHSRSNVLHDYHEKIHTQPIKPLITEEDKKSYYFRLINYEYHSLQSDSEIRQKSLFQLMDYCELQYENSNTQTQSGSHQKGIKSYIRGYLVFNYLINGFIMHHFNGFDEFIATNETDFIIYLNIYAFYNTDVYFSNGNYSVFATDLRNYMKDYLVKNNILSFDINELFKWLNEYISYLKDKDRNGSTLPDNESSTPSPPSSPSSTASSFSFIETYKTPDLQYEEDFKVRYPSVNSYNTYKTSSKTHQSSHHTRPPIPTQVPPSPPQKDLPRLPDESPTHLSPLRLSQSSPSSPSPSLKLLASSPPPIPPPHKYPTKEYPTAPSVLDTNTSPYPLQEGTASPPGSPQGSPPTLSPSPASMSLYNPVSTPVAVPVPKEESKYFKPKSYGRPKREVPDGYLRPTDYTTAKIHGSNVHTPHLYPQQQQQQYLPTHNHYQQQQPPLQQQQYILPSNQIPHQFQPSYPQQAPHYIQPFPYQQSQVLPPQQQAIAHPSSMQQPMHYHGNNNGAPSGSLVQQNSAYSHIPSHVVHQSDSSRNKKQNLLKDFSVCGLRNFGSSCYINSTIQLLFGVYEFKSIFNRGYQKHVKALKYLKMVAKANSHSKDSVLLSDATAGLLKTFQNNGGVSVSPTKFIRVTTMLKPDFNIPYEQQDAQEFLLFLLDRLHDEMADKSPENYNPEEALRKWKIKLSLDTKDKYLDWCKSLHEHEGTSPITDLFQGHLQNKLKCNKCGYESISYSQFTILSLPIPASSTKEVNLSDCLRYFIQDEVLSGENAWHCPKCNGEVPTLDNHPVFENKRSGLFKLGGKKKQHQNQKNSKNNENAISTKSVNFVKLPSILILQLGLFNFTDKLDMQIRYPLVLKFNNHGHEIVYKLSGMINHVGSLKSGHYTALVNKSNINEKLKNLDNLKQPFWCFFDDDNVKSNVANGHLSPPYDEVVSSDAYVLCYERIDI